MSLVDLATWKVTRAFLVLWSGYSCCPLLAPNCDHWLVYASSDSVWSCFTLSITLAPVMTLLAATHLRKTFCVVNIQFFNTC
ncbi:uncharacterized protein [Physcomitrium patens]|uniref:uncharacterized protein isoform X4 n=1 Tax=Physcomitrium patens TaxID=3218 RepID=UPI003CCD61CA